ncbi:MAG: carbohydrate-binding domain-containing protein [Oscillospiraceae bacterium]
MKHSNRIISIIICAVLSAGVLSACAGGSDTNSGGALTDTESAPKDVSEESAELPDISNAAVITLSDESAAVSGSGAEAENKTVTITDGGAYVVTGKTSDGRIIVNAPDKEVTVVLKNADISCSYGSPIYIYKSLLTTVYLTEGTANTLTDGSNYTFSDSFSSSADEEPNACLYSKSDLVIAGSGQLTVNANYNNGITSKDTLKIESSSVTVTALNHGINGKDCCEIKNAAVKITSGKDALRSTNDSDSALGYIVISNSSLDITAGEDGIQAENTLTINGGICNITSGGGSGGSVASDTSAKGLKGVSGVSLNDGVYTLNCYDDAIHSNQNVLISEGTYTITTADDGIHADENTSITGGTVNIIESYEGIEGMSVDISGGTINITSSDDGINAAGGMDQSGIGPRQDNFFGSSNCCINISGGIITVDANGDGVDANGKLTVSGGELYVSGPTSNGNGALDYDGEATITGGIVVAAGSGGMAQNFGSSSTQGSILLTYSTSSADTITLKDSSGNTLVSYSPSKSYSCVVISCPSVTTGSTYTVEACGQTTSVTMSSLIYGNSTGMGGMGGPGGAGFMGDRGGRP